jgi:hypothetical protein
MVFFILLNTTASASFMAAEPSYIILEDGNKIFYMTPPRYLDEGYPPTGLYYNTDPPQNIYFVISNLELPDVNYFRKSSVYISNDGMYFAYFSIVFSDLWITLPALQFYAEGNLIKEYKVLDLVKDESKLIHTSAGSSWILPWNESPPPSFKFNAENNTLFLTTVDEIKYTFDITTGEIINVDGIKNNTSIIFIPIIIISAAAVVFAVTLIIYKRKKKQWKKKDFKN